MRRLVSAGVAVLFMLVLSAEPAWAAWSVKVVGSDNPSPTSSLAISSGGGAFVAWVTSGSDDLYWAKLTANGWKSAIVAGASTFFACYSGDFDGVGPSAGFLPNGQSQIASACEDVNGGAKVMYSKNTAQGWKTTTVGFGPSDNCRASPTDVDLINNPTNGRPVIVIVNQCTGEITGFYLNGGVWVRKVMSPGGLGAISYRAVSLAVDPASGNLALAEVSDVFGRGSLFFEEFTWDLTYAAGSHQNFTLPNGDAPYTEPSLAFLPDGTGYLAFQEGTPFGTPAADAYRFLALIKRTGGTWGAPAVVDDAMQRTGADPSLSLAGGTLRIAYTDVTKGDLRYATSPDGSNWVFKTIAGPHKTGSYPSLGVRASGSVRIATYDVTRGALVGFVGP